jgi:hypothetical protein
VTLDALSHGFTAWVESHGRFVAACAAASAVLAMSREARAAVAYVATPFRQLAGVGVLWILREKVDARDAQHNAVMAKLEVVDALALEIPIIKAQLAEAAEDRKIFRDAVVEIAESRVELGGLVKAVDKLTDKLDDFCEDTVDKSIDHGERIVALEAERRVERRRAIDRHVITSPTEGG